MRRFLCVGPEYGRVMPVLDSGEGPLEHGRDYVMVEATSKSDARILAVRELRKRYYLRHYNDENPFAGLDIIEQF